MNGFGTDKHSPLKVYGDLTLLDYMAVHLPEPTDEAVARLLEHNRQENPHNDPYKPRRIDRDEAMCILRYKRAEMMLKVRGKNFQGGN